MLFHSQLLIGYTVESLTLIIELPVPSSKCHNPNVESEMCSILFGKLIAGNTASSNVIYNSSIAPVKRLLPSFQFPSIKDGLPEYAIGLSFSSINVPSINKLFLPCA